MIDRVLNNITVKDLLTPISRLMRADSIEPASQLFHEYDVVPSPRRENITGYFLRGSTERHELKLSEVISDETDVLTLVNLFCTRQFYFVLSKNNIAGLIHYSDLNKPLCQIPIFALFQQLERVLWENTRNRISSEHLHRVFEPHDVEKFENNKRKAEKHNVDVGWTGIFSLPYILKLSRFYGLLDLNDTEIKIIKKYRNRIAHSDNNLVTAYEDTKELKDILDDIQNIIKCNSDW